MSKNNKQAIKNMKPEIESDIDSDIELSDHSNSGDDVQKDIKAKKNINSSDESNDDNSENESENESETDEKNKKSKEKKTKESFEQLSKRLELCNSGIKDAKKEKIEYTNKLKSVEKKCNELERQRDSILKILSKTHTDEVNKALKSKPKRKGNINGGFNKEQPVPEILCKFIGLPDGTSMPRPKVMSALNNKFCELKLKNGQITKLDKDTAKALGLGKDGEGKEIKFTEFQSFLASFYPKKDTKIEA